MSSSRADPYQTMHTKTPPAARAVLELVWSQMGWALGQGWPLLLGVFALWGWWVQSSLLGLTGTTERVPALVDWAWLSALVGTSAAVGRLAALRAVTWNLGPRAEAVAQALLLALAGGLALAIPLLGAHATSAPQVGGFAALPDPALAWGVWGLVAWGLLCLRALSTPSVAAMATLLGGALLPALAFPTLGFGEALLPSRSLFQALGSGSTWNVSAAAALAGLGWMAVAWAIPSPARFSRSSS